MLFPIGDDQVQGGSFPIFSYSFIALNVLVFFLQLSQEGNLVCEYGTIPNEIVNGQDYYTLLTNMFLHGGWMHLIGNMLFLWVFADNIEATVGNIPFLVFYVMGGVIASLVHIYFNLGVEPNCCAVCENMSCMMGEAGKICSGSIPAVGASGAIAAVMGAYLVMFPKSMVRMLFIYFFKVFKIPAYVFLGFWIVQQLVSGFASLGPVTAETAGVAWWAHIGGFVFGVIAGFAAKNLVNQDEEGYYA